MDQEHLDKMEEIKLFVGGIIRETVNGKIDEQTKLLRGFYEASANQVKELKELKNQVHDYVEAGEVWREKDKEWKFLVEERSKKLDKNFSLNNLEKRKYVMSTNEDYEILKKIKLLEKLKLTKEDKVLVRLMKTQLEFDWRKYIIQTLNKLLKKYSIK